LRRAARRFAVLPPPRGAFSELEARFEAAEFGFLLPFQARPRGASLRPAVRPLLVRDGIEFSECGEKMMAHVAVFEARDKVAERPDIHHTFAQREIGEAQRGGHFDTG